MLTNLDLWHSKFWPIKKKKKRQKTKERKEIQINEMNENVGG